ncbi:uncharacterized protein LOC135095404 [Scylla paramamosain]|uniref:uncharacterized protein LOC135095404 n=1 Tax=Scylla paramamosain TaxID=85552 RepID=UPI0030832D23
MCPTCRASHAVPEAGQFSISYAVEGLVRRPRGAGLASLPAEPGKQTAPPVTRPAPKATTGLSLLPQPLSLPPSLHAHALPTLSTLSLRQPLFLPSSLEAHTLPTLPALPLRQAVSLPPSWRWGLSQQPREGCTADRPPPHWCPWRCGRRLLSSSSQCQYSLQGNHLKHHQ